MNTKAEKLLAPYLAGERPRENGDVDAHCPLHDDRKRSAIINFEEGVWYCAKEEVGGTLEELLEQRERWVDPPLNGRNGRVTIRSKANHEPSDLPSEATIEGWRRALMADPVALDDLKSARGLWTKTLDYFEIGWGYYGGKQAYTIPVRDSAGKLLNVRFYQLRPPKDHRKIWGVSGHNSAHLFPASALKKARDRREPVIICEGELDALITNQHNFRAVTKTSSAGAWRQEWSKLFEGLTVYVCHDMDSAGQVANRKVARSVAQYAAEVRVIRLPYAVTAKGGKDLTDWWLDHDSDRDAFRRLLEESQPFDESMGEDPEDIDPSPSSVMEAFDSRRAGRPLALTVTVKGRREPGYTVPRKVQFRCTPGDNGKACEVCPMKPEEGSMDHVIPGADPVVLEMIEATRPQLLGTLRAMVGIPKCPVVSITPVEQQAVEVLYARPSVEHSGGEEEEDYKNIKLTSVGRHDTGTNQTVRVVGALHPDPRKQLNEFLTWDVSKLETSLDRFEMDAATFEQLQSFQPAEGEQPLKKLRRIADDLAAHVTHIYGRPELHAAMDLVYHSVVSFDFDGKRLARGWMELLVVGDTRTGKSEVAVRLSRFYGAGEVVSCESATLAGLLGGLQQYGSTKEWSVTWGALPLNDRRLVVLDEVSGLDPEKIGEMSSARSSGIAELQKIQAERTHARTRLIWLGNPRSASMTDYTYGVQSIKPLIGNPEDIARFDLAMSVASGDIPASEINRAHTGGEQRFSREATATLLRWVWSRRAENIKWAEGATEAVYDAANDLGARYVEDPPLIQAANVREKVARLAVAIAARLFSTDDRGEDVIVRRAHVRAAVRFIDRLYAMPGFGYAERSAEIIDDRRAAEKPANKERAQKVLKRNPGLARHLRSQGKFRRQDLEEVLDIDREEANAIISELIDLRMVYKDKGDVRLTPTLHRLLREDR